MSRRLGYDIIGKMKKNKFFFTIIELIMIITIIGILILLILPRIRVVYSIKLQGATKKLVQDIKYTQTVAITTHTNYAISFNPAENSYQVYQVSSGNLLKDPYTHQPLVVDFDEISQYRGININSVDFGGTNILQFNWRGNPYDGNGNPLTREGRIILSYHDESFTIIVSPQTGNIEIQ